MSFILESPSERVNLGDPLTVLPALADLVRAADGTEYPALWAIATTDERPISDAFLAEARSEARLLMNRAPMAELSPRAGRLLDRLLD